VLLFNAVAKAQRAEQAAAAAGSKAPSKAARATFFAQVQGSGGAVAPLAGLPSLGGLPKPGPEVAGGAGGGGVLGLLRGKPGPQAAKAPPAVGAADSGAPAWQVLQDGFTGLSGEKGWAKLRSAALLYSNGLS
jgi:hypothetical protein